MPVVSPAPPPLLKQLLFGVACIELALSALSGGPFCEGHTWALQNLLLSFLRGLERT